MSRKLRLSNPPGKAAFLAPPSSRLAVFALEIYDGVSGKLLAFPGFGKEAMHIMSPSGGQFVFDAPDFLKQHIGDLCYYCQVSRWYCRFTACGIWRAISRG